MEDEKSIGELIREKREAEVDTTFSEEEDDVPLKRRKKSRVKVVQEMEEPKKEIKAEAFKETFKEEIEGTKSFFNEFRLKETLITMLMLFLTYILLNSDMFIDQILSKNNSFVVAGQLTTTGTIVQGVLLIIAFSVFRVLCTLGVF